MHQGQITTGQALSLLESALSRIDHEGRAGMGSEERLDLMRRARKVADRVGSLASVLTAEVESAQASMRAAGTPLTSFLSTSETRDSRDAAREVFKARDVAKLGQVRQAALDGEVSSDQAAAITQGMNQMPQQFTDEQRGQAEQVFLDKAKTMPARKLARMADEVAAQVAPELARSLEEKAKGLDAQRRRAVQRRHLSYGDDGDGSVWFKGSLPQVEAAPFVALIEAHVQADRVAEKDRDEGLRSLKPGPRVLREQRDAGEGRTPDQRRADALVAAIGEHRDGPQVAGDRPRIVVTIEEKDLRERAEACGVLANGAEVGPGELRRMCCDADLMPVVLGSESEILDVGRQYRLVTPAIRRALSIRDKGCVFPGCRAKDTACQAHHVIPWWAGGATAMNNLALLCPHHHAVIEPDRFEPGADQWRITFHPDTGKPEVHAPQRMAKYL